MNADILLIPMIGLCAICRGGRWHWDVLSSDGTLVLGSRFIHRMLLGMFWLGWSASLILGVLTLFGVWSTSH